jgi:hypothetical protein
VTVFQDKRRRNHWSYEFRIAGARYQGYCIDPASQAAAKNRKEAKEIEQEIRRLARQRQKLAKSGIQAGAYTLVQACALHLARKADNAPEDFDNHKLYVREIRDFFGPAKSMSDITAEDAEAYRKHAAAQTVKVWTGGPKRKKTGTTDESRFWKDTGRPRAKRQVNNYLKCLRALLAIAERARDPVTHVAIMDRAPEVKLHKMPKRIPRPIGDAELTARLETAPPWTRDVAELSRLFGLRHGEAFWLERRHISQEIGGLRFDAGETKSGNEELAHGGKAGWQLLLQLEAQSITRCKKLLVTWPGKKHFQKFLAGKPVPNDCWEALKSVRKSWKATGRRAGIEQPHRFHDVRARYITEVAKVQPAAAQDAARHQDPSTTALYIKLASSEIRSAVAQAVARRPKSSAKLKVVR